jgi:Rod binding domain-containing protein
MKTTMEISQINSAVSPEKISSANAEKACEGFESFFVSLMLNELQKTASFSEKGFMAENYMTIVNQKVSEFVAKKGIGIKQMLMRYMEQGASKVSSPLGDKKGNKEK